MVMKANKALKRIAKIEELTSEVTRRLSKAAPPVGEVLKDLKAAVARVKEAVSTHVSHAAKKKAVPARKKAAAKKAAVKAPKAKAAKKAKKVARVSRTVKKPVPEQAALASVPAAETAAQELSAAN
jgi:hypothetical protein